MLDQVEAPGCLLRGEKACLAGSGGQPNPRCAEGEASFSSHAANIVVNGWSRQEGNLPGSWNVC